MKKAKPKPITNVWSSYALCVVGLLVISITCAVAFLMLLIVGKLSKYG